MSPERTAEMPHINNYVVSTLGTVPCTDAPTLTRFGTTIQSMDSYVFLVPWDLKIADVSTLPAYSPEMAPGTVFLEAAGGERPPRVMEVIRHTPMGR